MENIEGIWQVEGRTIYELRQDGTTRKGEPVLVNRWSAHVQGNGPGSATPAELDAIAQRMGKVPELEAENAKLRAVYLALIDGEFEAVCGEYDPGGRGTILADGAPQCATCGHALIVHSIEDRALVGEKGA